MADTGTGTDPGTDRCESCGHPWDVDCGCSCCGTFCQLCHDALVLHYDERIGYYPVCLTCYYSPVPAVRRGV